MRNFVIKHFNAILLGLIIAWGIFLRLYKINEIPFGLYPDVAVNGLDALEILQGKILPFYYRNGGREGLFFFFNAIFVAIYGNKPLALYLTSSVIGILTLPIMYLFGKTFYNRRIALISTFLLASSFYHLNFSRLGYRVITLPLVLMFVLITLKWAFTKRNQKYWIIAGFFLALGFYTYISYRIVPFVLLFLFLVFRKKFVNFKLKEFKNPVFSFFITLTPMIIYILRYPADFFGRMFGASILSTYNAQSGFPDTLGERIAATLKMFFVSGDPMIQYNYAAIPLLTFIETGFFLIGIFLLIKNINKVTNALVLTISIALTLPIVFSDSTPHILRSFGMVPFLCLTIALGLEKVAEIVEKKIHPIFAILLITGVLIYSGINGYVLYFEKWATQTGLDKELYVDLTKMSEYALNYHEDKPLYFILGSMWNQKKDSKSVIHEKLSFLPENIVTWGINTWDPKRPLEPKIDYENTAGESAYFWEGNTIKYLVYSEKQDYEVRDYRQLTKEENGVYIFSKIWHPDFREKLLNVFPDAKLKIENEYYEVWETEKQ